MLFLLAYILADRRLIDDLEKGNSSFKWPSLFFVAILWLKFKPHMLTLDKSMELILHRLKYLQWNGLLIDIAIFLCLLYNGPPLNVVNIS